jgi:hypothetical protein
MVMLLIKNQVIDPTIPKNRSLLYKSLHRGGRPISNLEASHNRLKNRRARQLFERNVQKF